MVFGFNLFIRFEIQAHHDGELWGLGVSPSGNEIATIGEDNKLMIWEPRSHKLLRSGPISTEPIDGVARRVIRRAASTTNGISCCVCSLFSFHSKSTMLQRSKLVVVAQSLGLPMVVISLLA